MTNAARKNGTTSSHKVQELQPGTVVTDGGFICTSTPHPEVIRVRVEPASADLLRVSSAGRHCWLIIRLEFGLKRMRRFKCL